METVQTQAGAAELEQEYREFLHKWLTEVHEDGIERERNMKDIEFGKRIGWPRAGEVSGEVVTKWANEVLINLPKGHLEMFRSRIKPASGATDGSVRTPE